MPVSVTCDYCGQSKTIPPSQYKANRTGKFYCGYECHNLARQNRIQCICKQCGVKFERKPSQGDKFCSRSCHMQWQWDNRYKERRESMAEQPSACPGYDVLYELHVKQKLSSRMIATRYGVQAQTARDWIISLNIPFTPYWSTGYAPANKMMVPPEATLRKLYEQQHKTTAEIGEIFGCSSSTVCGWLAHYGIEPRPAGIGLATRGLEPPTPEELQDMIHVQKLTYEQVAARYGVDLTAVPYWLDKYGIPRPEQKTFAEQYADSKSQQEIRSLYESGLSLHQIASRYNVTNSVIGNYLRGLDVQIRRNGWDGGKRFECRDGHLVRSTYELRVDNWLHEHGIPHVYEPQLPFAPTRYADFLANGWYIEVWGVNHNDKYERRKTNKIELYRLHGASLIEVPAHAFATAHKGLWKRRLQQCLNPVQPPLLEYGI